MNPQHIHSHRPHATQSPTGWAWLDTSLSTPGGTSLIARDPERIIRGNSDNWHLIEEAVASESRRTGPNGAAIGWVGYDGNFCFGIFRHVTRIAHTDPLPPSGLPVGPGRFRGNFEPTVTKDAFCRAVSRAQDYIRSGDIYQVCLAHHFVASDPGCPLAYYLALRQTSPVPYGAYIDMDGIRVASASPELFLRINGRGILTRPIKGTRPRHTDSRADAAALDDLIRSPKEAAELVMITDLERNDLGQVCEFGTVRVSGLLEQESFAQVHHLVSTVEGRLRPEISHPAALRACFPGGSITGAPKLRATQIIRELEDRPRGLYTGAIGYFGFDGNSSFSIAIRTAVFADGLAGFGTGAGIVADSHPDDEWNETLHKASGLLAAARIARAV